MSGSSEEIACRFAEHTKAWRQRIRRDARFIQAVYQDVPEQTTFKKRCGKLVACRISPLEEWFGNITLRSDAHAG